MDFREGRLVSRKALLLGPNTLGLVEDAHTNLLIAVLAVREGENERDLKLPERVRDPNDDDVVHGFRQEIIEALSKFDSDKRRPAEQRFRRNAVRPSNRTSGGYIQNRTSSAQAG